MNSRLQFALETARAAGQILLEGYGKIQHLHHKGPRDLVTEFDFAAEALIMERIKTHYPTDSILAEESGKSGNGTHIWFIDPLDGTTNFAHNIPLFSVSIACAKDNRPILGVVYEPLREEFFYATEGGGAWRNDQPIQVSLTTELKDSLLVTGFSYDGNRAQSNLPYFNYLTVHSRGIRRLGSAALDLAYVATGRFDGYWEMDLGPWDWAAGILLVQEAGGTVTQFDGRPFDLMAPQTLVASNGKIHAALLEALKPNRQGTS